jgi:hypothetical protein
MFMPYHILNYIRGHCNLLLLLLLLPVIMQQGKVLLVYHQRNARLMWITCAAACDYATGQGAGVSPTQRSPDVDCLVRPHSIPHGSHVPDNASGA